MCLASKDHIIGKMAGVTWVNIFFSAVFCQWKFMRTTDITLINGFIGSPTRSLLITHANDTLSRFSSIASSATCTLLSFFAADMIKRRAVCFHKIIINVIFGCPAIVAFATRKSSDATSRIDNHCLTLWRSSTPEINVMRTIAY
jgi:hypothetical protein